MKKIGLLLVLALWLTTLPAQTVFKGYADGKIYIKCSPALLGSLMKEKPGKLPLSGLGFMSKLLSTYGVTKASRPFYHAVDNQALPYILKLEFSKAGQVGALIEALNKIKGIDYAEKVPLMETSITPNDPTLPAQLTQINAQSAWNVFHGGSNITVAIVDNAINWLHEDLVANTYTNPGEIPNNGIDDEGDGYIDDVNGWDNADGDNDANPPSTTLYHGTHCAGIAGACTNNTLGIASIGWNIQIIPVKSSYDSNTGTSIDDGYGGIIYAAQAGARVISCSWGGTGYSSVEQMVVDYAWNRGCLLVAAAGNAANNTQTYPGAYSHVFCVASVGSGDLKSSFSNYGTWVDIAAPGENIYSTLPSATSTVGTYGYLSGTSMATPLVAGLAALMLSKCPFMTQTDVMNCITSSAVNIYTLSANSTYSTGNQLGAGRIDAFQAMNCASGFLNMPPVANFYAFPRNTCPSTLIDFHDSSLYAPTSWNWTFQNGTPATSTSSNPSVQWATAGTYSVSLTVANANGTNTISKTSYMTVAGPISLPLSEGFQSSTFLPVNWIPKNVYNDSIYWERATFAGGFGTSSACAMFDNQNIDAAGERDEMWTPKYNLSGVARAHLRFDVAYAPFDTIVFTDTMEVKLSTDCGYSWTSIYLKGGTALSTAPADNFNMFIPTSSQWRTDSIDVSTLAAFQGNVMFSFVNRGHYGQPIYLDNINLACPAPSLSPGSPSVNCTGTAFSFTNTSTGATTYSWSFPGGSPATSTATNPSVSYANTGTYTITMKGVNGTTTATATRTISIVAPPALSVNSPTICSGSAAVLSPTGASSYVWSTGASTSSISVSPVITTAYTFTGNTGSCAAVKSVTVTVKATPTLVISPSPTICQGSSATLTAGGANNYLWTDGSSFFAITSTIVVNPSVTTTYSVQGSTGGCSQLLSDTVQVQTGPPLAILGSSSPSVCPGGTVTLMTGGANSYTWNTGATGATLAVSPTVTTIYTVTGINSGSCPSFETFTVNMAASPVLVAFVSPTAICQGGSATFTASGYSTYTWTGPSGPLAGNVASPTVTTTYTVDASIATGCHTSSLVTLPVNPNPQATIAFSNASCSNCSDGSATVTPSGGTAPYTYKWNSVPNQAADGALIAGVCYTVTVTDANGCIAQPPPVACISFETGIQNYSLADNLLIYPNPVLNQLTVDFKGQTFDCKLYDNLGQLLLIQTNNHDTASLDMTAWAKGVYFVEVSAGGNSVWKKLVKQ